MGRFHLRYQARNKVVTIDPQGGLFHVARIVKDTASFSFGDPKNDLAVATRAY